MRNFACLVLFVFQGTIRFGFEQAFNLKVKNEKKIALSCDSHNEIDNDYIEEHA